MNTDSLRFLLGDRPRFDVGVGAIGAPARQVFMTGAVHALKQRGVRAPRILEIGSWIGFSAFTWAQAIERYFDGQGEIVCIDPWEDYEIVNRVHSSEMLSSYRAMLTTGLTFDLFMYNVSYLGHRIVIQPLRGRSDRLLPLLREQAFDLVYIDGDHSYDAVIRDIELSLPLVSHGGILCGDDLDLEYAQCDVEHARLNRDAQPAIDPKTGGMFHPGVTLAVHELLGAVGNYFGFWAVTVEGNESKPLNLEKERCFVPSHLDPSQSAAVNEYLKHAVQWRK